MKVRRKQKKTDTAFLVYCCVENMWYMEKGKGKTPVIQGAVPWTLKEAKEFFGKKPPIGVTFFEVPVDGDGDALLNCIRQEHKIREIRRSVYEVPGRKMNE